MSTPPPPRRDEIAALIPAYLEERHLRAVVERTRQQVGRVLVVDDGSADRTGAEATAAGAEVLRHEMNQGKGSAIKTGLRHVTGAPGLRYLLLLDGDGQHLPEEIPRFLAESARCPSGTLLLGNRMSDLATMPRVRRLTNQFMSAQISRLCGQVIPDTQCGFRLIPSELFGPLVEASSQNFDYETEMLVIAARRGHAIASVPVSTIYGDEKSKIHPLRDTIRFFSLLRRLARKP